MWLNIVIIAGLRFRDIILVQGLATTYREGWTCLCRGKLGQDSVTAEFKTNVVPPFAFVRYLIAQKIWVTGNVK